MFDHIAHNSRVHDLIAPLYETRHGEIFNEIEQKRICEFLSYALTSLSTGSDIPRVLDFGAGTGNLTRHLLSLGSHVVASDVSVGCLRELASSFGVSDRLQLAQLNGLNLAQFDDASFDMVAVYSVLHHIPDYLALIDEFVRVVKPGGIIYIDHEVCPAYWENRPEYLEYCTALEKHQTAHQDNFWKRVAGVLRQKNKFRYLLSAFQVKFNGPSDDGDIHVHPDDHIEWTKIRTRLEPLCEILLEQDYLVCRERNIPAVIWESWRRSCADMRLIAARKQ